MEQFKLGDRVKLTPYWILERYGHYTQAAIDTINNSVGVIVDIRERQGEPIYSIRWVDTKEPYTQLLYNAWFYAPHLTREEYRFNWDVPEEVRKRGQENIIAACKTFGYEIPSFKDDPFVDIVIQMHKEIDAIINREIMIFGYFEHRECPGCKQQMNLTNIEVKNNVHPLYVHRFITYECTCGTLLRLCEKVPINNNTEHN